MPPTVLVVDDNLDYLRSMTQLLRGMGHEVDFAINAERERHMAPLEAIREACLLRFRPILMTTLAAALGALPLAIGFGDGAELRRPLGVAIIGGLIASQLLTLLTTPVVYLLLDKLRRRAADERHLSRGGEALAAGATA